MPQIRRCRGLVLKWRSCVQAALNALALSETVYRILDPGGHAEAVRVAEELCNELPVFARSVLQLQWSPAHARQRYSCIFHVFARLL